MMREGAETVPFLFGPTNWHGERRDRQLKYALCADAIK